MNTLDLPLFPLKTVLFPGGVLPLRIFEPRYLDMVSRCLRSDSRFAVVSITEGQEAGETAQFTNLGTLAVIVDFDQLQDGLLGITCRGSEGIKVHKHWRQADGLNIGRIERLPALPDQQIEDHHSSLVRFLRDLLAQDDIRPYRRWLQENWTHQRWIGDRIAELLPLPLPLKLSLLEMQDPAQRLEILERILRDNNLI